jgi:hypothetical protein
MKFGIEVLGFGTDSECLTHFSVVAKSHELISIAYKYLDNECEGKKTGDTCVPAAVESGARSSWIFF